MHRNLDRRVESMVRIDLPTHKKQLQEILDIGLSDQTSSWHLQGKKWVRVSRNSDQKQLLDMQEYFIRKSQRSIEKE